MRKNLSKKAFSLIELSIVILIIGVLVAGVIQGSRLMNAYKLSTARTLTQSSPVPSIKNLFFWLDATSESTLLNQNSSSNIVNEDTVSSWQDSNPLSFDKRTCSQSGALRPTYITNSINGLPAVRFDYNLHVNMRLTCSLQSGMSTENTIFIVFKWISSIHPDNYFFVLGSNTKTTLFRTSTTGNIIFRNYNGSNVDALSGNITSGNNTIASIKSSPLANSSTLYINGTSTATSTSSLPVGQNYTDHPTNLVFTIGNYPSGPQGIEGDIAEIIIYDRALRNEERRSIEAYLGQKWGINVN